MTTSYFALWIPTKKAGTITAVPPPERKIIQDNKAYKPYFIWGELDKHTFDFTLLYSQRDSREDAQRLVFTCRERHQHGFIIYSADFQDDCSGDRFLSTIKANGLIPSVYNFIKEHFHEHEHHSSGEDALLLCLRLDELVSLKNDRDRFKVAEHYLELYGKKFNGFLSRIKWEMACANKLANNEISSFKWVNMFRSYIRNGRTVMGEFEYCEFLMQHYHNGRREKNKAIRSTMESIRRELGNIKFNHEVCSDELNAKTARFGKRLGLISLAISLIVSTGQIVQSCRSTNSSNQVLSTIIQEERGVSREVQLLHAKVDSLIQKSSQPAAESTQAAARK